MQIPWITYRKGFIPVAEFRSDHGWGCMIRVAQMMLANTLIRHNAYRLNDVTIQEHMKVVLPLFLDNQEGFGAPFNLRNIVQVGKKTLGKGAGEWYGAHSISQVLKQVHLMYNTQYAKSFNIITFNEGVVYKSELTFENNGNEVSNLVLIPLRVGLEKVDQCYIPQIKEMLLHPWSVGILGGKRYSAMYYVGFNKSGVIALDPHTTQSTVEEIDDETLQTYRTEKYKHIKWSQLDTTMAFWFYLNNEDDAEKFMSSVDLWKQTFEDDYLIGQMEVKMKLDFEIKGEIEDDFEVI